jgi:hypothetical protein
MISFVLKDEKVAIVDILVKDFGSVFNIQWRFDVPKKTFNEDLFKEIAHFLTLEIIRSLFAFYFFYNVVDYWLKMLKFGRILNIVLVYMQGEWIFITLWRW